MHVHPIILCTTVIIMYIINGMRQEGTADNGTLLKCETLVDDSRANVYDFPESRSYEAY